jgi:hypothetical protein
MKNSLKLLFWTSVILRVYDNHYLPTYLPVCLSVCMSAGLSIYLSMALHPFLVPWPIFQFLDLFRQSVELLGRGISSSQGRYLYTVQHKQNKRTQTSMSQMGFEPTIPVFERAKTVHDLDRTATVIGIITSTFRKSALFRPSAEPNARDIRMMEKV